MKFKVKGFAYVPVQVEMIVEARSAAAALVAAKRVKGRGLHDAIVPNSEDACSVFDFRPSEAVPAKRTPPARAPVEFENAELGDEG